VCAQKVQIVFWHTLWYFISWKSLSRSNYQYINCNTYTLITKINIRLYFESLYTVKRINVYWLILYIKNCYELIIILYWITICLMFYFWLYFIDSIIHLFFLFDCILTLMLTRHESWLLSQKWCVVVCNLYFSIYCSLHQSR